MGTEDSRDDKVSISHEDEEVNGKTTEVSEAQQYLIDYLNSHQILLMRSKITLEVTVKKHHLLIKVSMVCYLLPLLKSDEPDLSLGI